jgi:hypothetical protein
MNKYSFTLAGSLLAILSARIYVLAWENLSYSFMGYQLHHFYYGISLLVIAGILKRIKASESLISFIIGMALGFIADEADLLLCFGRPYTLHLYNNPLNLAMDVILVLTLWKLSSEEPAGYYYLRSEVRA